MKRFIHHVGGVCLALCVFGMSFPTHAQVCKPKDTTVEQKQAAVKYLRRLSLDLRGRLPSYAEQLKAYQDGHVTDATIDTMIKSGAFLTQMRGFFKDLLTLNITDLRLRGGSRVALYMYVNDKGDYVSGNTKNRTIVIDRANTGTRVTMRGANVGCLPNEKAKYNANGELLCKIRATGKYVTCLQAYNDRRAGKKNIAQEGYEMVVPYWDSNKKAVKTCGYAALKKAQPKVGTRTYYCSSSRSVHLGGSFSNLHCGCGPNLDWCLRAGEGRSGVKGMKGMNLELMEAMMEQTLRFIDDVIKNDKSYTTLLTGKMAQVNGPLSHLFNKSAKAANRLHMATPAELKTPVIPYYNQSTWKSMNMGTRGAGILTLPFYTLKYATNRGRLHRYHNAFLCQFFSPPPGGLPDPTDTCHNQPDLTKRCGCKSCHQTIEPEAAHWGRWQENAWFPLNPTAFPKYDKKCDTSVTKSGNPGYCRTLYMLNPGHASEEKYKGKLLSYVFAPTAWDANIANGPTALVNRDIKNGKIASCGVKNMWQWFVGSDIQKQQAHVLSGLVSKFKGNNYNIRELVKAIVMSEEYRRGFETEQP
ncbi:MAG TPA: hypothetical protein DCE42_22590 [Myxococcales bacterium]|nr:hypothetical protein [Myxococcales bacterium]